MSKAYIPCIPYFLADLDSGESLASLLSVMEAFMGSNFLPSLLVLSGVGLAIHYEQLTSIYDGVPLVMAYGHPVSGKSTAVDAAMAIIGQRNNIGGTQI